MRTSKCSIGTKVIVKNDESSIARIIIAYPHKPCGAIYYKLDNGAVVRHEMVRRAADEPDDDET